VSAAASAIRNLALVALVAVAPAAAVSDAAAEDFYKGKTLTLIVGQPPGGGMDNEMRLVAHFLAGFIPGAPTVIPRNMPGAGGMILGNYLFSIARPDGLTLGMPGRSGFLLAPLTSVGDVKYELRKFTWIGSSASTNYILWLRKDANIRSLEEIRAAKRPLIIGGSGSGTANSVVPEILAKYDGLPLRVVRGYPGMNDAILAMERGEVDGVLVHRGSLRSDLIASGAIVPVFQTFAIEPDLPAVERFVTDRREKALLDLLTAPLRLGLAVIAPPGLPDDLTRTLRRSYSNMVASKEYAEEAARRGFDIGRPNSGEELADYVANHLSAVPPDVIRDYREYVERQ
jgi:tripartite-type tricarboxylate transporter receptor subunit TctC